MSEPESIDPSAVEQAREEAIANLGPSLMEDLERRHAILMNERNSLQEKLLQSQKKLQNEGNIESKLQEVQSEMDKLTQALNVAKLRSAALEEERIANEERIDRMRAEADALRDEISRLTKSNVELSKSVADLETQINLRESEAIPLWHDKKRLQTELDSLNSHVQWLEQELVAKQRDYQRLQQESRDRSIQLQLQLDQTANEKEAFAARLAALQEVESNLQQKITELSRDLLRSQQELHEVKETTAIQINDERRITELQKEHLQRWEQRYNDLLQENESLKESAEQAISLSEKELKDKEILVRAEYDRLLEEQAAAYEAKLREQYSGERVQLALLATATAGHDDNAEEEGPMSLTELYTRLEETKVALRRETAERQRWQLQFERVQKDIAQTAPRMIRQREEYELALDQLQDYQHRLEQALVERDDAREIIKESQSEIMRLQKRLSERQEESQELAKQVQALLVSRAGGEVADDIPTSIEEIQSQNQRLLMEHRRLTQQVEDLEVQLRGDEVTTKLNQAESEILALRRERTEQEVMVERIVQQRDLYRALLAQHDNNLIRNEEEETNALDLVKQQSERARTLEHANKQLEGDLAALRGELSRLGRDREALSERLTRYESHSNELTKSLDKAQQELITSRGEVKRSQLETEYHKERCQRVEDSLARAREEVQFVSKAKEQLQQINTELQESIVGFSSERAQLEAERRQAETKLRFAETQVTTAKSAETRLTEENVQLRAELSRQGALIDSIRRIETAVLTKGENEKETLQEELKRARQESESRVANHLIQIENMTSRVQQLEDQLRESQIERESAVREHLLAKKDLLESKKDVQSLSSKCTNLEARLREAKRKLGEDFDDDSTEFSMQSRIDKLLADLDASQVETASLRERVSKYEDMAKQSESALHDVRETLEAALLAEKKENEELRTQIESYRKGDVDKQEIIKELTLDLAGQRDEREKLKSELEAKLLSLQTRLNESEVEFESAKAAEAAIRLDIESLREDLSLAQTNYERELQLHAQARTSLRMAREQADGEAKLRKEAEEKVQSMEQQLLQQRESWMSERQSIEASAKLIEQSLAQTREENEALHRLLESRSIINIQQGIEVAQQAGSGDSEKAIVDLREIVRFLRAENEMNRTQLDTMRRTIERERAALQVARRSLDEARAELESLQLLQSGKGISENVTHGELSERLQRSEEQVRLLRDSNALLREEADKLRAQLASLQADLEETTKTATPHKEIEKSLSTKLSILQEEKYSLERELQAWKDRVTNLVSKFNQVDPEEHRKLLKHVEQLQKEKENYEAMKQQSEEGSERLRTFAKSLNQKNREQKALIDNQQKEIDKLLAEKESLARASSAATSTKQERDLLLEKIKKMEKDAESAKTELKGANDQNEKLRTMLRKHRSLVDDLKIKEKNLMEQLSTAESQLSKVEKQKALESVQPTSAPEPSSKDTNEQESKGEITASDNLPSVPREGFKFGPSLRVQAIEQVTKEPHSVSNVPAKTKPSPGAQIRADAPSFTPAVVLELVPDRSQLSAGGENKTPSKTKDLSSHVDNSADNVQVEKEPTIEAKQIAPVKAEALGEKTEMSMKEKLMEKKRRLAEAMERKRKAQIAAEKVSPVSSEQENALKRPKIEQKMEPKEVAEPSILASVPPANDGSGTTEVIHLSEEANQVERIEHPKSLLDDQKDLDSNQTIAVGSDVSPESISNETQSLPPEKPAEETVPTKNDEKLEPSSNPFKPEPSSNPFRATSFGAPTLFGQSTSLASGVVPTLGSASQSSGSSFGAFLNIKPPGSSNAPPTFTFGDSANIKLPIPSQTVATPSPFGAFGGPSIFGSFASSNSMTPLSHQPLFGAPTAQNEAPTQPDESKPIEEVEKGSPEGDT